MPDFTNVLIATAFQSEAVSNKPWLRRAAVTAILALNPSASKKDIAKVCGVSPATVAADLRIIAGTPRPRKRRQPEAGKLSLTFPESVNDMPAAAPVVPVIEPIEIPQQAEIPAPDGTASFYNVIAYLRAGKKADAVKEYRKLYENDVGLKEALDAVNCLQAQLGLPLRTATHGNGAANASHV